MGSIGHNGGPPLDAEFPAAFQPLFRPSRYKIGYGGRGGAKSWNFARALITYAHTGYERILCAREFQASMSDSVIKLLGDQIDQMGLGPWFDVQRSAIYSKVTDSEFLFKGLKHNASEIKSTEGITKCWIEEAQRVSKDSWTYLIPTIRTEGSEIWVSFNQESEDDETYKRFVLKPPRNSVIMPVTWQDNPFFPAVLDEERRYMLETDPESYEWIWGLECRSISDAQIFRGRFAVESFETPDDARFYHGVDFGFANDPMAVVRCYELDNVLYIDQEAYGFHIEFEEMPEFFRSIESTDNWPMKADCSRPETISYISRQGYSIVGAEKWPGSVEDGIAHIKGFRKVVIHERCKHTAQEFRLYSFKVDKNSNDILPIIVDKHNHCIDALRYSLDGFIQRRGTLGMWEKLSK